MIEDGCTAEETEHGVVIVRNKQGGIVMMANRKDWDALRAELGLQRLDPPKTVVGQYPLYGIKRTNFPGC